MPVLNIMPAEKFYAAWICIVTSQKTTQQQKKTKKNIDIEPTQLVVIVCAVIISTGTLTGTVAESRVLIFICSVVT